MDKTLREKCRFKVDRMDYLKQLEAVFQSPIRNGYDAPAVGNGDLAAVVWQPDHLTWMLNKCDISMEASQAARLVFENPDLLSESESLLETKLSPASASVTVRSDGKTGKMSTSAYIPNAYNALVIEYEKHSVNPQSLRIRLERWIQKEWGDGIEVSVISGVPVIFYELRSGIKYAVAMAVSGFSGSTLAKTGEFQLSLEIPAAELLKGRLAVAAVSSHESDNPVATAVHLARKVLSEDAVKLRKQHDEYWKSFWRKSFVDAGQPYANMLYHMALYELGITSRGRYPVKFNGALNLWNENSRFWGADYWCHNQHSVYLPVYAANHSELAENFIEWIVKVHPEAVKAGMKYFSKKGAYYPETMGHNFKSDLDDLPFAADMKYILSSGVRYAILLWNHYSYSLDEAFLRDKAYPVIHDVAEFYINYGKLGKDGKYHVSPSMCWETRPVGTDSHADCAAWRAIFAMAVRSAQLLGIDSGKVAIWKDRLENAPPYPVAQGLFSVVMRDDGVPEPADHFEWQISNLSGVFPYSVIDMFSSPELLKTAKETFERYRYNTDAGHEYLPVWAARLGLAEEWRGALFQFIQFFQCYDQGLFNYYSVEGNKDKELGNRHKLQLYLESSGIFAESVNEMLLQSHDGIIRVFPAVPKRWNSKFMLRAEGAFMMASEHRSGEGIPYILIQAIGGVKRECKVVLPWPEGGTLRADSEDIPFQIKENILIFKAVPGIIYELTPKNKKLENVSLEEIKTGINKSPARLGMRWYGSRHRSCSHTRDFPLW